MRLSCDYSLSLLVASQETYHFWSLLAEAEGKALGLGYSIWEVPCTLARGRSSGLRGLPFDTSMGHHTRPVLVSHCPARGSEARQYLHMALAPSAVRAGCSEEEYRGSEEEYRGSAYTVAGAGAEESCSGLRLVSADARAAGSLWEQSYFGWRSDVRKG